jgi:hypothetical protein
VPNPHYHDEDCSGPDFIAGSALGQRVWMLDAQGWLRGVTYRQVWLPGENKADCFVTERKPGRFILTPTGYSAVDQMFRIAGVGFGIGESGAEAELQDGFNWARCEGLDPECGCGYYAYHAGHPGQPSYGFVGGVGYRVGGVIEGYGKVILGSQGFRAQKARIRAIYYPDTSPGDVRVTELRNQLNADMQLLDRLIDDGNVTGLCNGAVISLVGAVATTAAALAHHRLWAAATALAVGIAILSEKASRRVYAKDLANLRALRDGVVEELKRVPDTFSVSVERMKLNYPDVEFYTAETKPEYYANWLAKLQDLEYLLGDA